MPFVTSIKRQKRRGWFNVWVDGAFAFSLSDVGLARERLRVRKEISMERLGKLREGSGTEKIWEKLVTFVSLRPRSEREIKGWMWRKKVKERTREGLFNKLKKGGWVNDLEFARWWIRQRVGFRPKGARMLLMELRGKGVEREVVVEALRLEEVNEEEGAKKVVEKQLRRLKGKGEGKVKEKLKAALLRRGYSWEVVRSVVDGRGGKA